MKYFVFKNYNPIGHKNSVIPCNIILRGQSKNVKPKKLINAPYIRGASERLSRILRPHDLILAHKPYTPLKPILSKTKDKLKFEEQNNVVYNDSM